MTCGLHSKLDAAYSAVREAFDTAHTTDALADNDLNLLFVYYQGIKKLKEALPEHKKQDDSITFNVDGNINLPDGCYDPDYNISLFNNDPLSGDINFGAAGPVTLGGGAGEDVLSFTTSGTTGTVTVPEHEDDEKIVL
tara:strand:- start:44 stop:457 length:414 start_codon:yes stop_codon:yes gene_type:complete